MSNINALAVLMTDSKSFPIRTKTDLKMLINTSAESVKIIPVTPSPALAYAVPAYDMPVRATVIVHSPTGRKWTAEVTRTESHVFHVK